MNRLAKHQRQLGQDNSSGINYNTLINLLKKIHTEVDPIIKQMDNFMNHGSREPLYFLSALESCNCDPCNRGTIEPDLKHANCPSIALGNVLRAAMHGNRRYDPLTF